MAGETITQQVEITGAGITNESFFLTSVSADAGATFDSFKISAPELQSYIASGIDTLYTADGTLPLSGVRFVELNGSILHLSGIPSGNGGRIVFESSINAAVLDVLNQGISGGGSITGTSVSGFGGEFYGVRGVLGSSTSSSPSDYAVLAQATSGAAAIKAIGHERHDASGVASPSNISYEFKQRGTSATDIGLNLINQSGSNGFQTYGDGSARCFGDFRASYMRYDQWNNGADTMNVMNFNGSRIISQQPMAMHAIMYGGGGVGTFINNNADTINIMRFINSDGRVQFFNDIEVQGLTTTPPASPGFLYLEADGFGDYNMKVKG